MSEHFLLQSIQAENGEVVSGALERAVEPNYSVQEIGNGDLVLQTGVFPMLLRGIGRIDVVVRVFLLIAFVVPAVHCDDEVWAIGVAQLPWPKDDFLAQSGKSSHPRPEGHARGQLVTDLKSGSQVCTVSGVRVQEI